jgi:hypothetical protein
MFDTMQIDQDRQVGNGIPRGLDDMEPGPVLGAFLSSIDVHALSGYDQIVVLRAHQRMASHYQAKSYEDMTAVTDTMISLLDDVPSYESAEAAEAEIRVALRLTRRAAENELSFALGLHGRLPQVFDSLMVGLIDVRRARTIERHTLDLPLATARTITHRVLSDAPQLTTGQLSARLERLRMEVQPEEARQRLEHAVAERRVVIEPTTEGTAHLRALHLPPEKAAAIMRRLNRHARSLKHDGETRTMDQLRTDTLIDTLITDTTGTGSGDVGATRDRGVRDRGVVDIHVGLDTLTALNDHPGELAGYGPVIADIARQVAQDQLNAQWTYTVTNPDGLPVATGTTRRRPTATQHRRVTARNHTCVFPGCRMPARDCDIDHTTAWQDGGPTNVNNLAPLCPYDHRIKHSAGWTYRHLPGSTMQWTTALGHIYVVRNRPP